ncbi:MAG TPA: hypothetical protein VMB91_09410 [Solirubrobacteraceae bacterium]|nr:hypothetical protein [Solirubrobacteraceae bacterium]
MNESSVLLHIWEIDASEEPAAVGRLEEMFTELAKDDAFVSARVLESPDRGSVAAIVEMRTAEDRRRLEAIPEVHETLEHLHGTANIVYRLYHEVALYT